MIQPGPRCIGLALLLALSPVSAAAQNASRSSELSADAVRARLEEAGYATRAASKWDDNAFVIEARASDGSVVRRSCLQ